jgi:hypothetical protein
MELDNEMSKTLKIAKVLYIFSIVAIMIYAGILYIFIPYVGLRLFPSDDPIISLLAKVLGILAIGAIVFGYLFPWLVSKFLKHERQMLFVIPIARATLFIAVGVFGLMLGILGAGWQISLPFIVVCGVSLILTFPTNERWKKMAESINPPSLEEQGGLHNKKGDN